MAKYLTDAEVKLANDGFFHRIDPGYGELKTAHDVMRRLELDLIYSDREARIGKMGGFERSAEQVAMREQAGLVFKALSGRVHSLIREG